MRKKRLMNNTNFFILNYFIIQYHRNNIVSCSQCTFDKGKLILTLRHLNRKNILDKISIDIEQLKL